MKLIVFGDFRNKRGISLLQQQQDARSRYSIVLDVFLFDSDFDQQMNLIEFSDSLKVANAALLQQYLSSDCFLLFLSDSDRDILRQRSIRFPARNSTSFGKINELYDANYALTSKDILCVFTAVITQYNTNYLSSLHYLKLPLQNSVLITADFHGNPFQIQTILQAFQQTQARFFVYLGDISPVRHIYQSTAEQKSIAQQLFNVVANMAFAHKFIMPGNTDYKANCDSWEQEFQDSTIVKFCKDCNVVINDQNFIFLSTVAATNHCLKDCEARERNRDFCKTGSFIFQGQSPEQTYASDTLIYDKDFIVFDGYDNVPAQYRKDFDKTIYERLEQMSSGLDTIIFTHGPPYNTCCDQLLEKGAEVHVGSHDLRDFIEQNDNVKQCFSGHIHQSVLVSDKYKDQIKQCQCYTVGNSGIDFCMYNEVWYLLYDLDTQNVTRFSIPCEPWQIGLHRKYK